MANGASGHDFAGKHDASTLIPTDSSMVLNMYHYTRSCLKQKLQFMLPKIVHLLLKELSSVYASECFSAHKHRLREFCF